MEQYKEKLKITNIFLIICCAVLAVFAVLAIGSELGVFPFFSPAVSNSHWASGWHGYIFGASIGIFSAMLGFLFLTAGEKKGNTPSSLPAAKTANRARIPQQIPRNRFCIFSFSRYCSI